ncbi:MAG TPA: hypothetical protein VHU19_14180 [Pyrinomonadaceae bacterium]|jgi:hypothetical protein|nr:hypothetical protein [Pyrinomonadaceae bacterium]
MRNAGIIILIGAVALCGLFFVVWLLGLVLGFTAGGLIHLLLLLALLVGPAGVIGGVVLILLGSRNRQR